MEQSGSSEINAILAQNLLDFFHINISGLDAVFGGKIVSIYGILPEDRIPDGLRGRSESDWRLYK